MPTQPEAVLEANLVQQLTGMRYERADVSDEAGVRSNLREQLGKFNQTTFSDREFAAILNHLAKGNVVEKSKTLRDRFQLNRDNGESFYVRFFNSEAWLQNLFQVTHQVTQEGSYKNRYDVTLLVNGLPLVQIELKRRGLKLKEAFNQINRYQRHSFWTNSGLFQYVQIFVISNGVNTKYYANNRDQEFKQTFFWADVHNQNITDLKEFSRIFLDPNHLGKMIAQYVVRNETHRRLMVLRPYQYYAVEAIVERVKEGKKNGYIWHTTGSGKTLTSFKASRVVMNLPGIHKVVFVVDRKDLDYQTMTEFNSFKKNCVDVTNNTASLVRQFNDNTRLIVTTIQKLNNAVTKKRYDSRMETLRDQRMVFIFDECHRSQFGQTHRNITSYFKNIQMFGFTGTPIFAENAQELAPGSDGNRLGKGTTKQLFNECLHKYVITDAINDENVLRFSIEYIGRYKKSGNTFIDIEVEDIDRREVLNSPRRLEKITDYLLRYHDLKTHRRAYSAIFAVSSIKNLIAYYELFQQKKDAGEHDLRIATIFSYSANEDDADATGLMSGETDFAAVAEPRPEYGSRHTREILDAFIDDYNAMFGTRFSTQNSKQFENYYKDIGKRIKDREIKSFDERNRIDILLVVNMFLTGFDAKKVNTLYVDKNLRYHGLVQAFSRTNRILGEQKSHGNILCFRNLKAATDEAIALFSNKEAKETILLPAYEVVVRQFVKAFTSLLAVAPTVSSVDAFPSEEEELAYIQAFRTLMRIKNVLTSFADFDWQDLPMTEQLFEDHKGKYLDLHEKVKAYRQKQKASILEDVDFELELIHRDEINVAYILRLLAKLKQVQESERDAQKKVIVDLLSGEVELRSKRELIEKFIEENLPQITDVDAIPDEFEQYWNDQKTLALGQICKDEKLDPDQFSALINAYIYSEQEPLRDDVLNCLDNRPSVLQAREIGERIIARMKEFVNIFIKGVAA